MCAIIDTYVGTVVAMVFGESVMGTLLCSSHITPPPNHPQTIQPPHPHHTATTPPNSPQTERVHLNRVNIQSTNGASALKHNTAQQSTNGVRTPNRCEHISSIIHKYIDKRTTPSKPYINTPVSGQLLGHVSPNHTRYPLNSTTF